ncbi:MAG: ATP-binding cassette domain-containing protein [Trebonia sp.]
MDSISKIDSITEEYGVDQAATGSAQPEPVVSVRGLVKRYGGHQAVAGIDLEVRRGEIFAFLGPNGAGKTTTVEILEGFRQRTQGQVSVLGQDPATADGAWPDRVGVVLQESEPEPGLSVRECLAMYAGFYRAPRDIDATIALVGLTGKAGALGTRLSGGQRRRLDFAVALIGDPELIFLDEPTTGFDPSARRAAWEVIAGLRHLGKTIFLTTHYMDEAGYLADRIAVLSAGRIVAEGTSATLGGRDHMTSTISFTLPGHVQAHDLPPGLSPLAEPGPGGSTILHSQSPLAHLRILGDQHEVGQLRRSGDDRMLAGVAGGIARYVSADVTLVRVIIAALALFTGAGAALYLVAWLLIPAEGYDKSISAPWIASRNREGESR